MVLVGVDSEKVSSKSDLTVMLMSLIKLFSSKKKHVGE